MTLSDVSLIGKKILVGLVVTIVPFTIIVGGLWLTQHLLSRHPAEKTAVHQTLKP
jgi:NhaP-type Na+/H+ or K+/H+ antiporter